MLARGTLQSGLQQIYLRKSGHVPDKIRWTNKSAGAVSLTVYAGPDGTTEIDNGTLQAGEAGETNIRGTLETSEIVKVDCDTDDAIDFCVTKVE